MPLGLVERGLQPSLGLRGARCEQQERGPRDRAVQEAADEVDRCRVGPVEVVEGDDERTVCRERLEQRVQRAQQAMPLIGQALVRYSFAGRARVTGKTLARSSSLIAPDQVELLDVRREHVTFECLGEDGERQVTLELGGAAGQRPVAATVAPAQDLGDQGGLPDSRLARDDDGGAFAGAAERVEQLIEGAELGVTPDKRRSRPG